MGHAHPNGLMNMLTSSGLSMSRRHFVGAGVSFGTLALAGCTSAPRAPLAAASPLPAPEAQLALAPVADLYAARADGEFALPAIPIKKINARYLRQVVPDPTGEPAGTIVVDTANHFLYLVRERRQAIRYGVGLGRQGFAWSGRALIERKTPWPRWFPPNEMIERQPELEKFRAIQVRGKNEWTGGMAAGLKNPLGARALYLFQNGKDTLYRIHGSPEWWTIGKSVSSGCVRMINQDVIDLFDRVPEQTPVLVTSGLATA